MPQPVIRRTRLVAAGLVALALAGCGSTVQVRSTGVVGGDSLSTGAAPGQGLASAAGPTSGTGSASGTSDGAGRRTTGAVGSAGGVATAGTSSAAPDVVPSLTSSREPVKVGVVYASGVGPAAAAMGIPGLATGDNMAQAKAVFDWINAHGGLGGHPIQGVYYDIAQHQGSNAETSMLMACTALTQDSHVRFVQTIAGVPKSGMECFSRAGVGLLNDETALGDADMATYAAHLANPGEIAPGRMLDVAVDDLWNRGWLTAGSKVGIFSADNTGAHAAVDKSLVPALRRHGLVAAKTVYVNPDGGDGGASESSSAVLQFRSAGVDRVIPVLYSPLFLMHAASTQGYRPSYALYSNLGPGALLETAAPADQLTNAVGIGWQPYYDIGRGKMPGPVSPRETLCFDIMRKAGQASTSSTTKGLEVQVCNVLFYLMDISAKQPSIPADLLAAGRSLLGSTFVSADTFRTDVTRRTDGVAGYRELAYKQDCSCFQYVSPVLRTS